MTEDNLTAPLLESVANSSVANEDQGAIPVTEDGTQHNRNSPVATSGSDSVANPSQDGTSVREIYKNSWLKHIPCSDKWSGRLYKHQRPEKFWVVFCVHDDKEAFLEFYENRRSAYSHVPLSSTSLSQCLHISPTIVIQENDHEFVITLESQVIKLAASTREQMEEWMDTMRNKLREMGILEPRDNLYSKEPVVCSRHSLGNSSLSESLTSLEHHSQDGSHSSQMSLNFDRISLRDPNSPLPPVPSTAVSTPTTSSNVTLVFVRSSSFIQLTPRSSENSASTRINRTEDETSTYVNTDVPAHSTARTEHPIFSSESDVSQGSSVSTLTQNLSLQYSQSVPSTPTTVVCSIYEPLFYPPMDRPMLNNIAVRNPSYENAPVPSAHPNSDSVPLLPPRTLNEPRRMSSMNDMAPRVRHSSRRTSASDLLVRSSSDNVSVTSSQISRRLSSDVIASSSRNLHRQDSRPTSLTSNGPVENSVQSSNNSTSVSQERNVQTTSSVDQPFLTDESGRLLSLREAQVLQLQSEISHKSGIRLFLRKRDCVSAIAFVECYGHVWVAGWKQKEHPLLHNKFHIGDRILSVSGHRVYNVQDTFKAIKLQQNIVEFLIQRIPHGKVLAMKREYEGQDLGIVREGGTAEIREVKLGGLATRCGLPSKAPAIESQGVCNWFLTEVNHRPLNLFFKDNEVNDRLNAVGLDISILVQPADFVRALRKQLKSIRGYKDYTLQ